MAKSRKKPLESVPEPELVCPPYPGRNFSVDNLYDCMIGLAKFVEHYRESSDKFCGKTPPCIRKHRVFMTREAHCKLPLLRLYEMFKAVRRFRAAWDTIVREFESMWLSDKAKVVQHSLLIELSIFLDSAYMSEELLEAKQAEDHPFFSFIAGSFGEVLRRIRSEMHPEEPEDGDDR